MKKIMCAAAILAAVSMSSGIYMAEQTEGYDEIVLPAIDSFTDAWTEIYADRSLDMDGYLEIKNTRIIVLKDDPTFAADIMKETYMDLIGDAKYVVEFLYFSDYLGASPYYLYDASCTSVLVYEDGTCAAAGRPIQMYIARVFDTDVSGFIEEVIDLGYQYNQVFELK